ncbi:UNVERIFIED_CONTAM: hypothetical protein Sradi_0084600 [Sesamum radiatum]|uniref:Uncharacterized protein n=1 Tax=Sesamum radiatum TaxID=300843 RepID=A0AAW2WIN2_SESRA
MKSLMVTFMIIMLVYSPAITPCNAGRLTYQEFGAELEKCGPCYCCRPDTPPCCLCACPVPP